MRADVCEHCGTPITQPRAQGRRKRFCSATCRGKAHRGIPATGLPRIDPLPETAEYLETLQDLYRRLKADVDRYGTLIETRTGVRANPSVEALRRVTIELDRRGAPAPAAEEPADPIEAALRSVS